MDVTSLLNSLGVGQQQPTPSYESDLSKLPEKQRPKYNSRNIVTTGAIRGFAGDYRGLMPDSWNPQNNFASPEEALDYQRGEGLGTLAGAGTLLPGLIKNAARMVLTNLAKRDIGQATGQAARAAEWMSPKAAGATGPAMLGEEAMQSANEASTKLNAGKLALQSAEAGNPVLNAAAKAGNKFAAMRGLGGLVTGTVDAARRSVDGEAQPEQPTLQVPEGEVGPTTDMSGQLSYDQPQQAVPSAAARLQAVLAGNKGLKPYQDNRTGISGMFAKLNNTFNHEGYVRNNQEDAARDYQNQMTEKGYMDPETQFKLQQLGLDLGSEREIAQKKTLKSPGQEFGLRYGPAMQPNELEKLYDLPAGSLDQDALRRMGADKRLDPMDLMMLQLFQNMQNRGGPIAGGGDQGGYAPSMQPKQVNVPPQRR